MTGSFFYFVLPYITFMLPASQSSALRWLLAGGVRFRCRIGWPDGRAEWNQPARCFLEDRQMRTDLISGEEHALTTETGGSCELRIPCPHWRFAVLVENGA